MKILSTKGFHFPVVLLLFILFCTQSLFAQQCGISQFRCDDGSCLATEKLCNNVEDCPNGDDEKGTEDYDCTRATLGDNCRSTEFKCRFGGCVPKTKLCNSVADCWGGTDESIELCASRPGYKPPAGSASRPAPTAEPTRKPTVQTRPTTRTTTTERYVPPPPPPPRSTPRPKPPPTTTPSTTTGLKLPSSDACLPIEIGDGQAVNCFHQDLAQVIHCQDKPSPAGTSAKISCKKYYTPPPIGSITTLKTCEGGKWVGGNRRFRCDLECGEGGFPPIALIAGGKPTIKGKWPWNVGLYESDPPGSNRYNHICGATLISKRAVMTAAHCVTYYQTVEPKNPKDLFLFLGKFNRTAGNNDGTVQGRRIIKIDIHQEYNTANLDSDIAILWLGKDAEITPYVHPVCIPHDGDEVEVGEKGMLAGWGSIGEREYPEQLQEAELPVVSSYTCRDSHRALQNLVRPTTFCAGHKNGTSACDGDSGGGLVFNQNGKWVIQGIVSGGVPKGGGQGCDPNYYVAFTKIGKYRHWIDGKLDSFAKRKR